MQRLTKNQQSGFVFSAFLLAAATILIAVASHRLVKDRELHLRSLIERSLTTGTHTGRSSFELEPGTLVTVRDAPEGAKLVRVHWQSAFAAFGDTAAWIVIFGLPAMTAVFLAVSFSILRVTVIAPLHRENKHLADQAADTRTMQMFAHDVRKPFSAVKAVIQVLQKDCDPGATSTAARRLLPEIDSLLVHVDQMIAEVLQKPGAGEDQSPLPLDVILDAAVKETERKHPAARHKIEWQLRHSHQAAVPAPALIRAIANLLCNAVEVMSPGDRIRIGSNDMAQGGIGITVGNSGPVIPEDVLTRLFTPFFTSGKQDGTGLGLAYVQSVVEAAGGMITVSSSAASGTEFRLNLPAARQMDKPAVRLPMRFNENAGIRKPAAAGRATAPLRVLVVEDNECYVEALRDAASDYLKDGHCHFIHARTAKDALLILSENPDIVICDIDLGPESESGMTVIRAASNLTVKPAIYMHSNAVLSAGDKKFVAANTDGILAKPVSANALAAIISSHVKSGPAKKKPVVAIIDDDCFIRELWSLKQDEITPMVYESPEHFFSAVDADPDLLASLDAVIVDYYFENSPDYTGDLLARAVRNRCALPVIMSSDVTGLPEETVSAFDLIVSKDCMAWDAIGPKINLPA